MATVGAPADPTDKLTCDRSQSTAQYSKLHTAWTLYGLCTLLLAAQHYKLHNTPKAAQHYISWLVTARSEQHNTLQVKHCINTAWTLHTYYKLLTTTSRTLHEHCMLHTASYLLHVHSAQWTVNTLKTTQSVTVCRTNTWNVLQNQKYEWTTACVKYV